METLSEILRTATAAVEETYFRLKIDGGDAIFRERVYCYELYHQMRNCWPRESSLFLNGEIDKQSHPTLCRLGADGKKPDLLIHEPGSMEQNHAVMEVKHSMRPAGIRKDLETLHLFRRKVCYQRAIYLIYGDEVSATGIGEVVATAREFEDLMPIEVWVHSEVGQPAKHAVTLRCSD